jgi:hypothetical protein
MAAAPAAMAASLMSPSTFDADVPALLDRKARELGREEEDATGERLRPLREVMIPGEGDRRDEED